VPVEGVGVERDAEVATVRLFWPEGLTTNQKTAALTALAVNGVIARA